MEAFYQSLNVVLNPSHLLLLVGGVVLGLCVGILPGLGGIVGMTILLPAITARTPNRLVPLAAQSRDEPVPYSLPAMTTSGVPSAWYCMAAS